MVSLDNLLKDLLAFLLAATPPAGSAAAAPTLKGGGADKPREVVGDNQESSGRVITGMNNKVCVLQCVLDGF